MLAFMKNILILTFASLLLVGCGESVDLNGKWVMKGYNCYDGNKPITADITVSIVQNGKQLKAVKVGGEHGIKDGMAVWTGRMNGNEIRAQIAEYSPPRKSGNNRVRYGPGVSSIPAVFQIKDGDNVVQTGGIYRSGGKHELNGGQSSGTAPIKNGLTLSRR